MILKILSAKCSEKAVFRSVVRSPASASICWSALRQAHDLRWVQETVRMLSSFPKVFWGYYFKCVQSTFKYDEAIFILRVRFVPTAFMDGYDEYNCKMPRIWSKSENFCRWRDVICSNANEHTTHTLTKERTWTQNTLLLFFLVFRCLLTKHVCAWNLFKY